jgi:hypothetical protein
LQVLSPLALAAFLLFVSVCSRVLTMLINPSVVHAPNYVDPLERAYSLFLFISTSLYTFILSSVFSPFRCYRQPDGSQTLIPKPTESCFNDSWKSHLPIITLGMLIALSIPLILLILLYFNRSGMESNVFRRRYGMLVVPYRMKFFWWELVLMFRKALLVMLIDLSNNQSVFLRNYGVILFLLIIALIEAYVQPYKFSTPFAPYVNTM